MCVILFHVVVGGWRLWFKQTSPGGPESDWFESEAAAHLWVHWPIKTLISLPVSWGWEEPSLA